MLSLRKQERQALVRFLIRFDEQMSILVTFLKNSIVEGTLVHGFLKMLFSSYMYLHVGKSLLVFEALCGAEAPLTPIKKVFSYV